MWDWIIPFLLKLLVEFLTELFSKWGPTNPATFEDRFIDSVKWRFWYGPKRVEWARSLYRQAAERWFIVYTSTEPNPRPEYLAQKLCDELKP